MMKWTPFPYAGAYGFDVAWLEKHWTRLHLGDRESWPTDANMLNAWILFHNGEFEKAAEAGLKAGGDGITLANKATCMYANYLESKEQIRLELFMEAALRAEAQQAITPYNANAWYWQAYALSRYSQGLSVAKALAQGLGSKIKTALEQTIRLSPLHADAHMTLAAFHADVIDKVGGLIGSMTYGVKKEIGLAHFREALRLNPDSAIAMSEYAHGIVMLEGDKRLEEASELYEQVCTREPLDAMELLNVEMVKVELQD